MQTQISSPLLAIVINHSGAEVCSIKNNTGLEFIWQADKAVWPRHAPVLFPIVGRLQDNAYTFKNTVYHMSQHGFARDKVFELLESKADSCIFQLRADEESKKNYPFDFVFQIHYRVEENRLITDYKVINPSSEAIFFSVGAHPGFNCPLLPDESPEDYFLEFENPEYELTELADGLRTATKKKLKLNNNKLFLSPGLFDNDALVFENGQIGAISLCSARSGQKITLNCKGWPYFGIWSKKGSGFICLEPWYGIAGRAGAGSALDNKEGIIELEPGTVFLSSFSLAIQ